MHLPNTTRAPVEADEIGHEDLPPRPHETQDVLHKNRAEPPLQHQSLRLRHHEQHQPPHLSREGSAVAHKRCQSKRTRPKGMGQLGSAPAEPNPTLCSGSPGSCCAFPSRGVPGLDVIHL